MSQSREQQVHLKGLNGIRAIAALAVVVSHTLLFSKDLGLAGSTGIDLAGFGVSIFFSLSGFLITYLLLLEKKQFSTINVKAFYVRRILRIWPLYYFYLLISVITIAVFNTAALPGSLFYYIFLCANVPFIMGTELSLIGHYWSLGVEEQFYLIWPWVVKKINRLVTVLISFVSVFILLKIGFRLLHIKTGILWPYVAIHVSRFECMAIGALGAVFFYHQHGMFMKIVFHPVLQVIAWATIVLMGINQFHIASVIDNDLVAVITVVLIMNVAANPKTLIRLDYPPFNFLGKISYGIYVYHPLILFFVVKFIRMHFNEMNYIGKYVLLFSIVLAATILVAWVSYEYFEKIFLRIKHKYALVKSTA